MSPTVTATTTTTTISSAAPSLPFAVPSTAPSTSLSLPSLSSRRGRRPGSKNALSKRNEWNQPKMSPAQMAAMLGIYSNPATQTQYNPAQVSALLEEYYKLQANLSPTSLLSTLESMGTSTSIYKSPAPKSPFSAPVSSKFPQFDMKSSVQTSTVVSNATSTVISVGSGQLTITPSTYSSSKTSKSSRPNESFMNYDSGADFDIESLIPKSELLTNKTFPDMSAMAKIRSNMVEAPKIPKDLPKSLTITPAPPATFSSLGYNRKPIANQPHVTLHAEPKAKSKKAYKRSATVSDFRATSQGMFGDVYHQQLFNLNMMNMMSQTLVPNTLHRSSSFQQSSNKEPKSQSFTSKKETKPTKNLPFPMPTKNRLTDAQSSSLSNPSRNFQATSSLRTNPQLPNRSQQPGHRIDSSPIKFTAAPMTAHSPKKSTVPPHITGQPAMHQVR